ncbi:MAG: hypothetical protein ACHQRJ_12935 [Alphaproteobacteria bacterium]
MAIVRMAMRSGDPMRLVLAASLVLVGVSGCGYNPPPTVQQIQAQISANWEGLHQLAVSPYYKWESAGADCSSPDLVTARDKVIGTAAVIDPVRFDLNDIVGAGSWILDVADGAKRHGCKETARYLYDYVISTYVGSGYAGLRERAHIGIDDLRH